jgi:hypothetical protein
MMTAQPEPHSRWRLVKTVDGLASSYDAAARAIDALARSAGGYDPGLPRTGAQLRAAGRRWVEARGLTRTAWFMTSTFLMALFLAWISLRILRHALGETVPAVLGVVPGILLALALSGTAALTAAALAAMTGGSQVRQPRIPVAGWLLAVAGVGIVAWTAAWLIWVTGLAAWAAGPIALIVAGVLIVALVAASLPLPSQDRLLRAQPQPTRPPRRTLSRQREAQKLVRKHARLWSLAAQHCGLAVSDCPAAQAALARLVMQDELGELSPADLQSFHAQLLATLSAFRLGPLRTRLDEAGQQLLVAGRTGPSSPSQLARST